MQNLHTTPLIKNDARLFLVRLGKIFSNLSLFLLILCLCGALSFVLTALIILVGIIITIVTLGTIFVIAPNFFNVIIQATDITANISAFFFDNFYIFAITAIIGAVLSLVLLRFDNLEKHKVRTILSAIIIITTIIAIVVFSLGVIK